MVSYEYDSHTYSSALYNALFWSLFVFCAVQITYDISTLCVERLVERVVLRHQRGLLSLRTHEHTCMSITRSKPEKNFH